MSGEFVSRYATAGFLHSVIGELTIKSLRKKQKKKQFAKVEIWG